jgi:hypothetical protein
MLFKGKTFEARPPKVQVVKLAENDLKTLHHLLTTTKLSTWLHHANAFIQYDPEKLILNESGIILDTSKDPFYGDSDKPLYIARVGDNVIFDDHNRCEVLIQKDGEIKAGSIPAHWKENVFVEVDSKTPGW